LNTFPMARKLITSNSELSANQLRELAENDPRVEQLANAYPNEVLLESDIRANNTLNSYKSVFPTPPSPSEQNQTSTQTSTQETGS
jgi:hypothetical protein